MYIFLVLIVKTVCDNKERDSELFKPTKSYTKGIDEYKKNMIQSYF